MCQCAHAHLERTHIFSWINNKGKFNDDFFGKVIKFAFNLWYLLLFSQCSIKALNSVEICYAQHSILSIRESVENIRTLEIRMHEYQSMDEIHLKNRSFQFDWIKLLVVHQRTSEITQYIDWLLSLKRNKCILF